MIVLRALLGRRLARRVRERAYLAGWWWRQRRMGHRIRRAARLLLLVAVALADNFVVWGLTVVGLLLWAAYWSPQP